MMSTREGLFCKTRNYMQQSDLGSSSTVFSEANKSNMVSGMISCDYYDDDGHHHGNEYMKMKVGDMEMEEDHEKINGVCGEDDEKRRKKKKKSAEKVRRPRYAFQTRSQVDILDDGYRWRKYGQKAVKNNKFPRSYYRCTHQGCNVKKQVQRLSKDEEVVVTTYEGKHTHPIERNNDNFEHILNQMQIYTCI